MASSDCPPDMLWLSDARDVIEYHEELTQLFKKASRSRGAKRTNDSFLLIATTIVSLEILARDYANWGKQFPAAQREAKKVLGDILSRKRTWLMDLHRSATRCPSQICRLAGAVFRPADLTRKRASMHRIVTAGFFSSAIVLTAVTVAVQQAAATDMETGRHVVKHPTTTLGDAGLQRACSWVGPGGRAIYICK
jgi:hypothetical protein